jgi:hypothetical protein
MGMTEFAEGDSWVHFKNPLGAILSCRRYIEDYRDLGPYLRVEGEKTELPVSLKDAVEFASIFSEEQNKADNRVEVDLRQGQVIIRGIGISGKAEARNKVKYGGRPLKFTVSPKLLMNLVEKHNQVEVTKDRLKVDSGNWRYIACLDASPSNGEHQESNSDNEEESKGEEEE